MAAGAARDRFGTVHQQTPGFGPGSATLPVMALLRRKPRAAATPEPKPAKSARATKPARAAKSKPAPDAPIVEQPPVAEIETPAPNVRPHVDQEWM